jgi:hypothetical protein
MNTSADTASVIEEVYDYFLNWSMPDEEALDAIEISGKDERIYQGEDVHDYKCIQLDEKLSQIEYVADLPYNAATQNSFKRQDNDDDSDDKEGQSLDDGIACESKALAISLSPKDDIFRAVIISTIDRISSENINFEKDSDLSRNLEKQDLPK